MKIMGAGVFLRKKGGSGLGLEKRIKFLRETPFFQYLTAETLNEFAQCFPQTIQATPGQAIALDSQNIYVVCEGEVDLSTSYPVEGTKIEAKGYLCRKKRGDIVHVRSAKEDVERHMSVKSQKMKGLAEDISIVGSGSSGILLLCGDRNALDKFSKNHPELSKPIVEILHTSIEDRLSSMMTPFQEISKSKLSVLAAMCRYEAFDSNTVVFEEDSDADKLFLVISGVAQVIAKSKVADSFGSTEQSVTLQRSLECSGGDRKPLVAEGAADSTQHVIIAELKSGDYFGETGLVFQIDRTCSVRAAEKCLFLTVHKNDFENFLKIFSSIKDSLKRVIKQRMVSKLSSLKIPYLNGVPEEMLSSLGSSVEIIEVSNAGEVIFKQGDVGDSFYIIVHGSMKVETAASEGSVGGDEGRDCDASSGDSPTRENQVRGTLHPGQYFGEVALNSESNLRTATVTSAQRSILLRIDKDKFQTCLGCNNTILTEFEIRLLRDSAKLKHVLAHPLGITSFRAFLEMEHAGENIDFWVTTGEFEANASKEQAKHIFVTFCAVSS